MAPNFYKDIDMPQTEGRSCDELRVIVVDENSFHARATESTLAKLNFHAMVYTSPIEALNFLKDHEQDVGFILVAVHMKEMHGFQFLGICREMHKNLQVIMMSIETTWPIMQRCVELGARFLVKKPLITNTICNMWQYLDQKHLRMEKIKNLFKGIQGNTDGDYCRKEGLEKTLQKCEEGTRKKTSHLIWTPFLQSRFLHALELLGDDATPKKIEMLMNVNSIDRKQISAHLQKHKKRMEKELNNSIVSKKYSTNASSIEPLETCEIPANNDIHPNDRNVEEILNDLELIIKETQGNKVYESMRKSLQRGTMFDEQFLNDPSSEEAKNESYMVGDGIAGDNHTYASGQERAVPETHNADNAKDVINKADSYQTGVVKLVTYSDSEDDK